MSVQCLSEEKLLYRDITAHVVVSVSGAVKAETCGDEYS